MTNALFIFSDDDADLAVAATDCDTAKAYTFFRKMLSSKMCLPIRQFDALEFATLFVAVNKSRPYDICFCGEHDDGVDFDEINAVYHVYSDGEAIVVTPTDRDDQEQGEVWAFEHQVYH
tara:strand:- start:103 stop:459 length:357 start_codon:yes stop_codon:yes gene_type:complete